MAHSPTAIPTHRARSQWGFFARIVHRACPWPAAGGRCPRMPPANWLRSWLHQVGPLQRPAPPARFHFVTAKVLTGKSLPSALAWCPQAKRWSRLPSGCSLLHAGWCRRMSGQSPRFCTGSGGHALGAVDEVEGNWCARDLLSSYELDSDRSSAQHVTAGFCPAGESKPRYTFQRGSLSGSTEARAHGWQQAARAVGHRWACAGPVAS